MKTLYLIRHARSELNDEPDIVNGRSNHIDITDHGIEQSQRLGQYLMSANIEPGIVVSSPANRTLRSGELAVAAMGYIPKLEIDDRLQELDTGDFTGRNRKEVYTEDVLADIRLLQKDHRNPNGESMNEVAARMREGITDIAAAAPEGSDILVITHGLATRCLVGDMLGWDYEMIRTYTIPNTSFTILNYDDDGLHADPAAIGLAPHLTVQS